MFPAEAKRRFVFFDAVKLSHVDHTSLEAVHYHLSTCTPPSVIAPLFAISQFNRGSSSSGGLVRTRLAPSVHLHPCCHPSACAPHAKTLGVIQQNWFTDVRSRSEWLDTICHDQSLEEDRPRASASTFLMVRQDDALHCTSCRWGVTGHETRQSIRIDTRERLAHVVPP